MKEKRHASRLIAALAVAALVAPMAGTADANPCEGFIGPNELGIQIGIIPIVDEADGPLYLDVRSVMDDNYGWSIWVYQETNGIPGLQRGDRSPYFPDGEWGSFQDPCVEGGGPWDLILF